MEIVLWFVGVILAVIVLVVVVDRRRGSFGRGDGPPPDMNMTNRTGEGYAGDVNGPMSSGGPGG
ncbi:hypothetical protein [Phycicoccus sonneratiae]|uniref:Uncharacterized protein n=1 Tax=Phycicoccus sonneratiae TaxID=2807628 RepID=A0ABS2CK12_9MICO|nr:hypothetical protein [Phycicoccus sonneraticus]MBM6399506.1 hypothetical protein [Phycicoccus sonneraticus]